MDFENGGDEAFQSKQTKIDLGARGDFVEKRHFTETHNTANYLTISTTLIKLSRETV